MEFQTNPSTMRTEMIMQNIKEKIHDGKMEVSEYDKLYTVIYETLERISTNNIIKAFIEMKVIE